MCILNVSNEYNNNDVELDDNSLIKYFKIKDGTREYVDYKGNLKDFINKNNAGGFEIENIRYSILNIIDENNLHCNLKFLGDEFDHHTRVLGKHKVIIQDTKDSVKGLLK